MGEDLQSLSRRMKRLEEENFRLRVVLLFMFLGVFALGFLGFVRWNREIVAERFVLVDSLGNARVTLSSAPEGPVFAFLGPDGSMRMAMVLTKDVAGIALCDTHGVPRMGIALVEDIAGIAFGDPGGSLRMGMALAEGEPVIGFYDAQGNLIRQLP
ncbi:hypothetical protein ACP6EK_02025 [Candidatus Caldatribacterium sp. SIUC1]|uniref:hypothetical protein n=1 Tax=Candidatus Caldatribacterium sp. SIUC1 TaxID=3418365 RepID=UPI003F68CDDB